MLALYRLAAKESAGWDDEYPNRDFVDADISQSGLYVMEEGGALIGAVSLIDHDDLDELSCWRGRKSCVLARLCTRPDRRRQGIGFRLTGFALEQARRQGCDSVRLLADVRSATAGRLYERAGFERCAEAELYGHRYYALEYLIVPLETL